MKHLDLFSGIGGFALAAETIWPGIEHIFCDNDSFSQAILKKHWPNAPIYGDIRTLTNTQSERTRRESSSIRRADGRQDDELVSNTLDENQVYLLTGGFPCQPFSQAGRRKGTADDRYLWPEMLRVIREFHPRWVIGENVGGFVTWSNGLVLEQVQVDLEGEGYEVQAFIIPACSVNAPHRRDRVWIVAHAKSIGDRGCAGEERRMSERFLESEEREGRSVRSEGKGRSRSDWEADWREVASRTCVSRMDDGVSERVDGYTTSQVRIERMKACGNAIVPAAAEQIMRAIKEVDSLAGLNHE
jgi:DNA (cytosine-5)-methyltransferase 1